MVQAHRVLVTGATGFLGGAVVRSLLAADVAVAATRRANSPLERLAGAAGSICWFETDAAGLASAVEWVGPHGAIVHAATCYGRQGESWQEVVAANLHLPLRLLDAARDKSAVFFNIGTVLAPQTNAYALSKHQFAEWGRLATQAQSRLCFVNVRLEHIYGPGDDDSKFVTRMIRRCLANEPEIALTEGRQRRDFIYIDDAVAGLRTLLDAALAGRLPAGFNEFDLGSGQPVSIRELVEAIHRLTGSHSQLNFGALPYRAGEVMESAAATRALEALGWSCRTSLEAGLKQLIESEMVR